MCMWGPPKNGIKCEKHCSYGHLARSVQKVCKIAKNAGFRNIKSGYQRMCVHM